jgi:CDP-diacylglycerol--glycerol-3-phosphate 3-phosphatidyltransferase
VNLPNTISAVRIATAPLVAILPFLPSSGWRFTGFALFLASAISDHVDGRIARSRGLVTDLGKLLDPLADKLLLVATFVPMFLLQARPDDLLLGLLPGFAERSAYPFETWGVDAVWFHWWVLVLILGREAFITWFRTFAKARGVVVAAQALGKWKAVFQYIWVGAAFFWFGLKLLRDDGRFSGAGAEFAVRLVGLLGSVSMVVALALTLISLWSYVVGHRDVFTRPRTD